MNGKSFLDSSSTKILQDLAVAPIDLTSPGIISKERIERFSLFVEGFTFSYAMERVDDGILSALTGLASERGLLASMKAMQNGEVVNYIDNFPSESRPALHTATRAWVRGISLTGNAEDISLRSKIEVQRLRDFLNKYRDAFTTIVQIGIGGSELGPKALHCALKGCCPSDKKVYFVSNVDPDNAAEVLQEIDCSKTLVVTVSKSGTTLETAVNEELFADHFLKQGLSFRDHFIAVTCEGSPMDDTTRYLEVFHIWDSIGGRFSSTSMVGGVVLGFAYGFDAFIQLLEGAAAMDLVALEPHMSENLPMLSAMLGIWNRNFLRYPTTAVIPYSMGLEYFPAHLQQCGMESNGKSVAQTGELIGFSTSPILWGELGTNSQHSFFQALHQGSDIVPVEFIGFLRNQRGRDIEISGSSSSQKLFANMIAQSIALAKGRENVNPNKNFKGNRPSSLLVSERLTPYTMGALLAFYEHKIVFQGFCWGINSFDQEGVTLGKDLANQVLRIMQGQQGGDNVVIEAEALLGLFDKNKKLKEFGEA
ncbi:glucose-6-phosphate isomerase [Chlamydia felis Fe/C-56]|uniref:Glucose-6-phosphate isomerase n=1 Tax=Chlamydia felis (strain Fe/C-56) TaxID=264202 RepID=G6PI_CHLFF|nr:glucose-6-phosphate isomerase [Chlamydia felis]Q255I6.1 RecName: Full=Glucose-6-phosphate isomerase; Short=GPI; AltName: Full=Phosphoglucose isomerase; Short=PGI; AltName: Full=Phosphohexose isomerase; Short=PHI [Chlamydia felis Fe/C-56]BAE81052.1 glucose-6-phosphate isomerase [Chlamydia felis Fe/C-56]